MNANRMIRLCLMAAIFALAVLSISAIVSEDSDAYEVYEGIRFEIDESTTTATVVGFEDPCPTSVAIPYAIQFSEYGLVYTVTAVGNGDPLSNSSNIVSISLPSEIYVVGDNAFIYNDSLNTVVFNESCLQMIGNSAFAGCSSLTDFSIPDTVTTIGPNAFCECTGLTTLTIGASVSSIGEEAFANCPNILNLYFNAVSCNDLSNTSNAFLNSGSSSSFQVTFGNEVLSVPGFLFHNSDSSVRSKVANVVFGDNVNGIGAYAFYGCSLSYLDLNPAIVNVGAFAFSNNSELENITIGSTVSNIGMHAFSGCSQLEMINLNSNVLSFEHNAAIFSGSGSSDGFYLMVDDNVTKIPDYLFYDPDHETHADLDFIQFGSNVKTIGKYAFAGCSSIQYLYLTETIKTIEEYAFCKCTSLIYADLVNIVNVGTSAFESCTSLSELEFGNYLSNVGDNAFKGCSKVEYLVIKGTGLTIGAGAFSDCAKLKDISYDVTYCFPLTQNSNVFSGSGSTDGIEAKFKDSVTDVPAYLFYNSVSPNISYVSSISFGPNVHTIGDYAFFGNDGLSSVTITNTITSIGSRSFSSCSSLSDVTIGTAVASIGNCAFSDCPELFMINYDAISCGDLSEGSNAFAYSGDDENGFIVYFGSGVTRIPAYLFYSATDPQTTNVREFYYNSGNALKSIGEYAFYNTLIEELDIPGSVESVGAYAFGHCGNMTLVYLGLNLKSIGTGAFSMCPILNTIILDSVSCTVEEGYGVFHNSGSDGGITLYVNEFTEKIPDYLFYDPITNEFTGLGGVSYSTTIFHTIGKYAFYGCTRLPSINIPDSVSTISEYAFYGCTSLNSPVFGNSVETVGSYAFANCSSITDVDIDPSFKSVGDYAFADIASLGQIYFYTTNCTVGSDIFANSGSGSEGIFLAFANGVYSIPDCLFNYTDGREPKIVELWMDENVTSIGEGSFYGCKYLRTMNVSRNVTVIGDHAFAGCTDLVEIYYDAKNCSSYAGGNAFLDAGLSSQSLVVTFGTNVNIIPDNMFYCTEQSESSIVELVFGNSVKSIGDHAFELCIHIEEISFPDSLETIGKYAFSNCIGLEEVTYGVGLNSIGECAFNTCTALKGIVIPDSVSSVFTGAFGYCENASTLYIGTSLSEIADDAFFCCTSLTAVTLPSNISKICASSFTGCSALQTLDLGSVQTIDYEAFLDCISLESVTIPDSVYTIGMSAFMGCTGLKSLTIGTSVISIALYAFNGCTGLTALNFNCIECDDFLNNSKTFGAAGSSSSGIALTFGNAVESIPEYMFFDTVEEAAKIKSVSFGSSVFTVGDFAFTNSGYITTITFTDSVTSIGRYSFSNCSSLKNVMFGSNVNSIGEHAFDNCKALETACLPENVTVIEQFTFCNCAELYDIGDASNLVTIGASAFEGCSKLYDIDLSGVRTVNSKAFAGCTDLITMTIGGAGMISIGENAFYDCRIIQLTVNFDENWGPETVSSNAFPGWTFYTSPNDTIAFNDASFDNHVYRYASPGKMSVIYDYYVGKDVDTDVLGRLDAYAGTLTFTTDQTSAEMMDFTESSSAPWSGYKSIIKKVIFNENVVSIGEYAFFGFGSFDINADPSAVTLGDHAFDQMTRIYVPSNTLENFRTEWPAYSSIYWERINYPLYPQYLEYNGTLQWIVQQSPKYILSGEYAEIDAGKYLAYVSPAPGYCWMDNGTTTQAIEWTMIKTSLKTVSIVNGVTFTYSGDAIVPSFQQLIITVSGGTVQESDVTITAVDNIKAGTATLTVTAKDSSTNYGGSASCDFIIDQRIVSVSQGTESPSKEYDGSADYVLVSDNYVFSYLHSGDDLYLTGNSVFNSAKVTMASYVKVDSMSLGGDDSGNYALSTSVLYLEGASITPLKITAGPSDSCVPEKVYDGTTLWIPASSDNYVLSSIIGSDEVFLGGKYAFNVPGTDASKVIASDLVLIGADADNYYLENSQFVYASAKIDPRTLIVTPDAGQSKTYGDKDPVLKFTYSDNVYGETPAFKGALSRDAGENVGSYPMTVGDLGLSNNGQFLASNYTVSFTPGVMFQITVRPIAKSDFSIDLCDETYTGSAITKTITSGLKAGIDYTVSYTDNVNVGTALITITGIGNYAGSLTYSFVIQKMQISIPEPLYYVYTGGLIEFKDFPVSKYFQETTGNVKSGTAAGTYQYRFALTDTDNTRWADDKYTGDYCVYITVESKTYYAGEILIAELESTDKGIRADGELVVTGTYDVPEDTRIIIKDVKGEVLFSYDIRIMADGKEIQPAGKVTVRVLVPYDVLSTDFSIYHIHGGEYEKVSYEMDGDYAVFTVNSFSDFVFVKNEKDLLSPVNIVFYVILGVSVLICAVTIAVYEIRKH